MFFKKYKKEILWVLCASALVLVMLSMSIVETGYVGIKIRLGAVQSDILQEGLNWKAPFSEKVEKIDCRTQRVDIEGEGASKDLQTIATYIAVNYRIGRDKAVELYKTVGKAYETVIIKPAIQESMKSTTAKYTAEELIAKRSDVASELQSTLKNKLESKGIVIESVSIVNLNFSQAYDEAIEQKQVAEQEAKKAQQELEKAKIEAEKKVVEAQAEADSLKAQKEEITQELLQLRKIENEAKWIEKWNGQLPTTTLSESIPMISIGS